MLHNVATFKRLPWEALTPSPPKTGAMGLAHIKRGHKFDGEHQASRGLHAILTLAPLMKWLRRAYDHEHQSRPQLSRKGAIMSLGRWYAWVSLVACAANAGWAADSDIQQWQSVVAKAAEEYTQAFAARDVKRLGALFTPEAEYIDGAGTVFHGRAAIEAEYTASFEIEPPGTLDIELVSIRPIANGVLVEDGVSTFKPKEGEATSRVHYSATHVKQADGSWLLASVRETSAPIMSAHDRLTVFTWLVGKWHEDVGGSSVTTEWKWSEDGNFLISEFVIRTPLEQEWKGTHRIGWDAERKQFRSWVFESNGGAMEGWWQKSNEGAWSVSLNGIDDEGTRLSARLTYTGDGKDALIVTQEQRVRSGENLPDTMHRVVRQPPAPGNTAVNRSRLIN